MLPPSTVLAVYGIITEQDIGKLFIAGIIPGILAASMDMLTVVIIGKVRPNFLPATPRHSWAERRKGLIENIWATLLLFVFVIGGLYGGLFTPTEAGGVGASGALLIGVARGKLTRPEIRRSLLQAVRTAAAVLTVLIGALLFGYFLTVTQTPQKVTAFMTGLGLGRYGVLALIMLMYIVLGCLMDSLAMIILTIPIIFPVIMQLGFDPIWFGVIIVMTVELGLIHPVRHGDLRHQERGAGRELFHDIQRRAAVHRHRFDPAGDLDRVPDPGAVAAVAYGIGRYLTCISTSSASAPLADPQRIDLDLGNTRVAANDRAEPQHAIGDGIEVGGRRAAAAAQQRRAFEFL